MAKTPSLLADEALDVYLNQLLKTANIFSMPEDYKKSYKERLAMEVNRRIGLVVMNELKKEDLEEFERLMAKDVSPKEIQDFFTARVPNLQTVVRKGLDDFAAEFIEAAKK